MARVSIDVTVPAFAGKSGRTTFAAFRYFFGFAMRSRGPPRAPTILPKSSAARPDEKASAIIARPMVAESARPPETSTSPPSATVTAWRRLSTRAPVRNSTAFITSTALPAADASGSFMSVMRAVVLRPAPLATATRLFARARESSIFCMKAPEPVFTSRTRALKPAASFLDRIEAVISGIDSTVAVTSRMA